MTSPMHERRRSARQRAFLAGKLYFNNRLQVVDCTIRDISAQGARLTYSEGVTTPDDLELYIPQKDQTLNVKVVWRRGEEVGVEFQAAAQAGRNLGPDEIAERFARLEAEIADLKRIIKKLRGDQGSHTDAA